MKANNLNFKIMNKGRNLGNVAIKIFCILLVSICLFSCRKKLHTNNIIKKPYVVKSIDSYADGWCLYNLETGADYHTYIDEISFIDYIGKFHIGDSVEFTAHTINRRNLIKSTNNE